jgi:hypothetical protein
MATITVLAAISAAPNAGDKGEGYNGDATL